MEEQGVNETISLHVGNKCQMLRTMVLDNQSAYNFNKERSGQWSKRAYFLYGKDNIFM